MFSTIPTSIPKIVPIKRIILFDSVNPPQKYYMIQIYIKLLLFTHLIYSLPIIVKEIIWTIISPKAIMITTTPSKRVPGTMIWHSARKGAV